MAGEAKDWATLRFSDCAVFQEGYVNPPQSVPAYFDGDIKWLRAVDLNDSFVFETSRHLSRQGFESAGRSALLFEPETIAISKSGTIGRLGILKDYMCGNRAVINIRVDKDRCDSRFVFYNLLSRPSEIDLLAEGSVQRNLYCSALGSLSVRLPPLLEQRAIAHILGTLDDRIELNRRMNETLEAMARALFKSWFVNFDPVRAKTDDASLSQPFEALFPDAFEDSELGAIPKGWSTQSLSSISNIHSGGTPSKSVAGYWNGDLPWISPKVMTSIHVDRSDEMVTAAAVGNGTRLIPRGSILIMVRGMGLHQAVRISQARREVTLNQDVKACVPKWGDGTFLLFALLDASAYLFSKVQASGHGTGVLPTDILDRLLFAVPPAGVRDALVEPLANLNAKIAANIRASRTLTALRDALLPKLISGELRVKTAEKMVEAVA